MFNLATKLLLTLTGLALVAALVYGIADDDLSGLILLLFLGVGAATAALVLLTAGRPGPTPGEAGATSGPPALGASGTSAWPVLVALSVGVMAVGTAVSAALVSTAIVALALCLLGWLAQSLAEHAAWDNSQAQRLADRLLLPVGLPIGVVLLVAVIIISLSRVLLALPKEGSTVMALVAAVLILVGCTVVAARPQLGSGALIGLAIFAGMSLVAGGIAGAVAGERDFEHHAESGEARPAEKDPAGRPATTVVAGTAAAAPSGPVVLKAKAIEFDKATLRLASNGTVEFHNDDAAIPHNFALYPAATGNTGPAAFKGDVVTGPAISSYKIGPVKAGAYLFQCDIHPTMKGKAVVS